MVSSARRSRVLALFLTTSTTLLFPLASEAQPKDSYDQIQRDIDHADYDEALKALSSASTSDERANLLLAEAFLRTGKYAEAADFAKKVTKKPALLMAACVRAEALFNLGKRDEAVKVLKDVKDDADARGARVLLGDYLIKMGKRGDAHDPLMSLISDYNQRTISATDAEGLTLVGRASHLLRSAADANDAYSEAEKAGGKKRVDTLLDRADLFLEKYDPGDAGAVIKEAAAIAPNDPRVHVAAARVNLEDSMDFDAAERDIEKALAVNPSYADAYVVKAGLALRDLDIEAADAAADAGLKSNPTDLDLLSMKAAIRFLADDKDGFEKFKKRVFDLDPEYSTFYRIVGEFAEWEHRYEDLIVFMTEATKIDPQDGKAYADLGMNLIRAGREDDAMKALKRAWDLDDFNPRVKNTLDLFEKTVPTEYVTVDGTTFKIRYNKSEKAILERYVPKMLDEAWGSMVKRYHFTPTTPVQIELYADSQSFSVRTSGLPDVGIQGVCFGHTLALLSPSAGPFNWGNVLWHELGHIFAIQLSKNHVPRWFTEGLSEYETIVRRPEWQREEDPALFAALRDHRIPAVAAFNRAFTHVNDVGDVTMAYYAASQIIVFIAEKYGFDKVVAMLPLWGNGERTPDVVQHALGVSASELDKEYRAWLDKKLARYSSQFVPDLRAPPLDEASDAARTNPTAKKDVSLALALLKAGKEPEARASLSDALKLDPKFPEANYILADLAIDAEKYDDADKLLKQIIADGHDGYSVRMKEAVIAQEKKDTKGFAASLEAAHKLDPQASEPLGFLEELAEHHGDGPREMDALHDFAMLEQHDREAWGKLLEGLVARAEWEDAAKVGESAVFVDVANPEIHRLYARALARTGKFISAVYEYNSAIIAGADPDTEVEIYGELAKAYEKLGEPKMAEQAKSYQALAKKHAEALSDHPRRSKHTDDSDGDDKHPEPRKARDGATKK